MEEWTKLPRNGESWFKNRKIKEKEQVSFLREPGMEIYIYKKGILVTTLKGEWRNLLLVIQKNLTFEGSFITMFFYHAQLLMHFIDGNEIKFPYFLLCSLRKMASIV